MYGFGKDKTIDIYNKQVAALPYHLLYIIIFFLYKINDANISIKSLIKNIIKIVIGIILYIDNVTNIESWVNLSARGSASLPKLVI